MSIKYNTKQPEHFWFDFFFLRNKDIHGFLKAIYIDCINEINEKTQKHVKKIKTNMSMKDKYRGEEDEQMKALKSIVIWLNS